MGANLDQGFARINTFSWDAYHVAGDLIPQVEDYKELHGHYPELVLVDQIYATQKNRRWLKKRGIRITAPPLGRPKAKTNQTYYQKRKARKEAAERNQIEGKFGQGKNGYNLNEIRARLKETSESWVACIFFVMNLIHYEKVYLFGSIFRWLNGKGGALVAIFEFQVALIELNYQSAGKSGRLQYGSDQFLTLLRYLVLFMQTIKFCATLCNPHPHHFADTRPPNHSIDLSYVPPHPDIVK